MCQRCLGSVWLINSLDTQSLKCRVPNKNSSRDTEDHLSRSSWSSTPCYQEHTDINCSILLNCLNFTIARKHSAFCKWLSSPWTGLSLCVEVFSLWGTLDRDLGSLIHCFWGGFWMWMLSLSGCPNCLDPVIPSKSLRGSWDLHYIWLYLGLRKEGVIWYFPMCALEDV